MSRVHHCSITALKVAEMLGVLTFTKVGKHQFRVGPCLVRVSMYREPQVKVGPLEKGEAHLWGHLQGWRWGRMGSASQGCDQLSSPPPPFLFLSSLSVFVNIFPFQVLNLLLGPL